MKGWEPLNQALVKRGLNAVWSGSGWWLRMS